MRAALADLAATSPDALDVAGVRAYVSTLREKGLAPVTIRQRCSLLQAIVQTLVLQGHLETNAFQRVDTAATSNNHIPTATPEQVKLVFQSGDPALLALLFTGLRISELVTRQPQHLKDGYLDVCPVGTWRPKNESSHRHAPIPDWLQLKLPTPSITMVKKLLTKACPGLSPHSLRHAFRTACREAQIPTELGEALMGHAQMGLVGTYGTFSDAALRVAAEKAWAVLLAWAQ